MYRATLIVAVFAMAACSTRGAQPTLPHTTAVPQSLFTRMPDRVGDFALTDREGMTGLPGDSLFRYSDGSVTRVSVIVYHISDDVKVEPDSQKWTAREGEKFREVQEIRKSQGQIAAYAVAFSDTNRVAAGGRELLEHSQAVAARSRNGAITVELQYLYLIGDKFVKVRASVPQQGWQQTTVPVFCRELARRLAGEV